MDSGTKIHSLERLPTNLLQFQFPKTKSAHKHTHTCGKGSNYECNVEIEIKCQGKPHFRQMPNRARTLA